MQGNGVIQAADPYGRCRMNAKKIIIGLVVIAIVVTIIINVAG